MERKNNEASIESLSNNVDHLTIFYSVDYIITNECLGTVYLVTVFLYFITSIIQSLLQLQKY